MKCCKSIMALLILGMLVITLVPTIKSEEDSEISVEVMIDFGNGIVQWEDIMLGENRTAIKATEEACSQLNLDLVVEWFSFGVFINGIGGLNSPDDWSWWWSFLLWNKSAEDWEGSNKGANDVQLNDGDIIGWCPSSSEPMAVPALKYPWAGFQHDAFNSGSIRGSGPSTNNLLWSYDTETIELAASPAIVDGKVIINNWGGVFCFNLDGKLLWNNKDMLGSFSPAISNEKVFIGGKDGYLYALNFTNGEPIWKREITAHPGISGVTSAPTVVNGKVFVGSFNFSGGPGSFYCLDEDSGNVLWKSPTSSSVYFSSPCVSEEKVYIGTMGLYDSSTFKWAPPYELYCFDTKNGEVLWNFSVNGSIGSSPTTVGDRVIFTSKDGYLYCLNATNGNLTWRKEIGSSVSSPAVLNGAIFVGAGEMNMDGKFYRFDMNGNKLWEFEPNGAVQSSPAIAEGKVYFATNVQNSTIYCLDHSTRELIWSYTPSPKQYIISSPAICEGKLFIGCDNGRLYCFEDEPPQITVDSGGVTQIIKRGNGVRFNRKGEEHKVMLRSITKDSVILELNTKAQTLNIAVGETKNVDMDGNGKNDLAVTLNSTDTTHQTASLTFKTLDEPEEEGMDPMLSYALVIIFVVILIIACYVVAVKH